MIFGETLGADDLLPLLISCCIFGHKRILLQTFHINTVQTIENIFDTLPSQSGGIAFALTQMHSAITANQQHLNPIQNNIEHVSYHYILKYVKSIRHGVDNNMKNEMETLFSNILTKIGNAHNRVSKRYSFGGSNRKMEMVQISLDKKQKESIINLQTKHHTIFQAELNKIINNNQTIPFVLSTLELEKIRVHIEQLQTQMDEFFEKHFIYKPYDFSKQQINNFLNIE